MSPIPTCKVLGTPLAVTDYAGAVAQAADWASTPGQPRLIAAANTHVTTLARRDSGFREAMAKFDLVLPDGMPLVWVMNRQLATPLSDRVYGPTFMLHCLEATQGDRWRHLFIGGTEELLAELRGKLLSRFPRLQIAGTFSPPFGEWNQATDDRIISIIEESAAQFVWIGLGCPKQELWLARVKHRLPPAVYSAVGAAFAFHAGRVRQAPLWLQRIGMEWLFRLCAEPRRLWRRYVVFNSLFVFYLVKDGFRPPAN
jgi:N-acetylglucosaminyldiphosphoundecaprenol N-acetyl-beta-D-mannosaminyltransferase